MNLSTKIILIALALTALATTAGWFIYSRNYMPKIDLNVISDAKIYKNTQYNFSIKYPSSWTVKESSAKGVLAEFTVVGQPQLIIFTVTPSRLINDIKDLNEYISSLDSKGEYYQGTIEKIGTTDVVIVKEPRIDNGYHMMAYLNPNLYLEVAGQFDPVYEAVLKSFRFEN